MNRLNRNAMYFFAGMAMIGGIATCSNHAFAHTGHVLDHEEVANRLFCSAIYAWAAATAQADGDDVLLEHTTDRSNRALLGAKFYARLHKHSDRAFDEAAAEMFLRVVETDPEDAIAFFKYLDCESLTEESALL